MPIALWVPTTVGTYYYRTIHLPSSFQSHADHRRIFSTLKRLPLDSNAISSTAHRYCLSRYGPRLTLVSGSQEHLWDRFYFVYKTYSCNPLQNPPPPRRKKALTINALGCLSLTHLARTSVTRRHHRRDKTLPVVVTDTSISMILGVPISMLTTGAVPGRACVATNIPRMPRMPMPGHGAEHCIKSPLGVSLQGIPLSYNLEPSSSILHRGLTIASTFPSSHFCPSASYVYL